MESAFAIHELHDGHQAHIGRFLTPQQAVARAAARFDGPVEHAFPGAAFSIGQGPHHYPACA
ncbi:hypothetical protein [Streptomyces scopuliridis]|uniref:hypothetical protein n=1 Tax=Streptomyces scopuliridis TaxID=452529 RepID=UPI0035D7AB76